VVAEPGSRVSCTENVDRVEEMGADKYAYFTVQRTQVGSEGLAESAADSGKSEVPTDEGQVVARLAADSAVRSGENLTVWFDPNRIHLFDPKTGRTVV